MCSWSLAQLQDTKEKNEMHQQNGKFKISTIESDSTILSEYFANLNEDNINIVTRNGLSGGQESNGITGITVTYSHFLPRQELCPEKRFLSEPHLTKVMGSTFLEDQIRLVSPNLHIVSIVMTPPAMIDK